MLKKIVFVAGVGAGFVLGSRAGRESYEKIKVQAQKLWNDPKVQHKVSEGTEWAKEKAPQLQEKVTEKAKGVLHKNDAGSSSSSGTSGSGSYSGTPSTGVPGSTGTTGTPGSPETTGTTTGMIP
ncbi:YtxH domain-containing protein [Arthrobacter crystallopoietes]|uniref:YtxH domain-containing protein n=1 Tax=Crystallibacter crystallopoietes TaxID=37928 RepID=UPI0011110770|nr:YtxH domain-containing protein [Arthrobacter crystallopoietes]